jgi:restriction system protein
MKRTIVQAIKEVMQAEGRPLSAAEIYDVIISTDLYTFRTDKPVHVVSQQIRRHCVELDFSYSGARHFIMLPNGKYYLRQDSSPLGIHKLVDSSSKAKKNYLIELKRLHRKYVEEFRRRVLDQIKRLEPSAFEIFCKNLLTAYGFRDVTITRPTKDGGIDGHGRLKVGFTYFSVAFQCKRWNKKAVGRPEIDQFRGAIQGQFEQGIFFTTANFSPDAERSSFKAGAVPITLINGPTIVDIMIEKNFGVETESLPLHSLALDLALSDEFSQP